MASSFDCTILVICKDIQKFHTAISIASKEYKYYIKWKIVLVYLVCHQTNSKLNQKIHFPLLFNGNFNKMTFLDQTTLQNMTSKTKEVSFTVDVQVPNYLSSNVLTYLRPLLRLWFYMLDKYLRAHFSHSKVILA